MCGRGREDGRVASCWRHRCLLVGSALRRWDIAPGPGDASGGTATTRLHETRVAAVGRGRGGRRVVGGVVFLFASACWRLGIAPGHVLSLW